MKNKKNYNLSQENQKLKEKISHLQLQNSTFSNIINYNNILNNPNNANQILFNLAKKNQELNEVIERYPFKLEKNEKLLSVLVQSVDQNIRLPIICKNNCLVILISFKY